MSIVLGISNAHNGSVALISEGVIKCAIQAERISRKKTQELYLDRGRSLMENCVLRC